MNKKKYYLGIDLGTSSVKGILRDVCGCGGSAKKKYSSDTPNGWIEAVIALIAELNESYDAEIAAIGLSSQVGTYIVDGEIVIPWSASVGRRELDELKAVISQDVFETEISMPHPELVSYPLPRLTYIQKHYGEGCEVLMPKELLIRELTGNTVTDMFSMRGIANLEKCEYSRKLLDKANIRLKLPTVKSPTALAGCVGKASAEKFGLSEGVPVYLGCNDFFAGLVGMGIYNVGDAFDLSGTSEHVGYIGETVNRNGFVSGKYFNGNCTYGGTKSSGICCDFAIKNFGLDGIDVKEALGNAPPILLPYFNGERAPIFDENARGVYFGINADTDVKSFAYSTLEGVAFSLFDIANSMNMPTPNRLVCGGGSAKDKLMNKLRATLFGCDVVCVEENDTSALGACMLAMVGNGAFSDIRDAISVCIKYGETVKPDMRYSDVLKKRYAIYKELYTNLKNTFVKFNNIQEEIK